MYISHKHKLIFVRVPKTACSSITEFLIKNIKDNNAIHSGVDDSNIKSTLPNIPASDSIFTSKYVHYTLRDIIKDNFISEDELNDYKMFSVIRNPIDRQKSMYYFRKKWDKRSKPSLNDYKRITINNCAMKSYPSATGMLQTDFLKYNDIYYGNLILFENIEKELNNIIKDIGLNVSHPLPNHKSGNRKRNEIIFDQEVINSLKSHYKKDFEVYNSMRLYK